MGTATTTKVTCGANSKDLEGLVGKTIGDVRREQAETMTIPSGAKAYIGGKEVKDNYAIKQGDALEFNKPSGSKG